MHVALTGASGFIGSVIARDLHAAGHTVAALVRPTSRRDHVERWVATFVEGNQDDRDAWPALLDGADAVIHNSVDWAPFKSGDLTANLASNLTASIELLQASAPRPFVFMSSVAVHHDMRPRWDGHVDEDHPPRPGSLYGAYKAAVEAHLWWAHHQHERAFAALRPCAVYGLDPRLERSIGYPIVAKVRDERAFRRRGGGKFVHVDDVAAMTVAAVTGKAPSGVYDLADCYARWGDLAVMIGEILGIEADVDLTSPPASKNAFTCAAAHEAGIRLDRGHDGIRSHLQALIEAMNART